MPDPIKRSLLPLLQHDEDISPISAISSLSFSSSNSIDTESDISSDEDNFDTLVSLMESLPSELLQQIWSSLISNLSPSVKLSTMLTSKSAYKQIIPTLYRNITLISSNCNSFFYGLGPSFQGDSAPEENWPVSGPGIAPLHSIGLSYDPSKKVSSFIRKFTLCNLCEHLIISDTEALVGVLRASSECWKFNMNTWTHRVLFDQIDSISFGGPIFTALDQSVLIWKSLLGEIWNCIKSDCITLQFPPEPLKEDTYKIAINILGSPKSLGQQGRLLDELIIYTPQLDGVDLDNVGVSKVKIVLIGGEDGWVGCKQKNHLECLSQEAQLRRFVRRHWLVGIDNTEYIGIPQEVEKVDIHNVANYNRRRCITGRITAEVSQDERSEEQIGISLPTVLYGALEGDEELAVEINRKVHFLGSIDSSS